MVIEPVIVWSPLNIFEPVVANVVDLNSSSSNLLSTDVDNSNCVALLADIAVAALALYDVYSAFDALILVSKDEESL